MPNFVIETSARHVHVTREALDTLFGKGSAIPLQFYPHGVYKEF